MAAPIELIQKQFLAGRISSDKVQSVILNSQPHDWIDPARVERNPNYPKGDNSTRQAGFTHNPRHYKGQYFQKFLKPAITKLIDMVHGGLKRIYDPDIYKFDDSRLQDIDAFTKDFIYNNFADDPAKIDRMNKIADIILGIMKEDPFYSSAGLWFFNCFIKQFPNGFELSQAQKDNREMAHMREFYCYKCKRVHHGIPTRMEIDTQGNYIRDEQGRLRVSCYGSGDVRTRNGIEMQ